MNVESNQLPPEIREDVHFLVKQLLVMDYLQDSAKIAEIAKRYGAWHPLNDIEED